MKWRVLKVLELAGSNFQPWFFPISVLLKIFRIFVISTKGEITLEVLPANLYRISRVISPFVEKTYLMNPNLK